jgi:glycosyltransferase involved in cell wall biosynthesis
MKSHQQINVAVLLATYNGARFIEQQIKSLMANFTPFTLHWLDDHSTDNTREVVRAAALRGNIELREWHQTQHLGLPSTFFRLLECVEADIYFFCDQDDIWQPGKIDATVENLLPDIGSPVLCFSDSLLFSEEEPDKLCRLYQRDRKTGIPDALRGSRMFTVPVMGHSQGFTRHLRGIFLKHAAAAHDYAFLHDAWMYHIAMACGVARILPRDAPVALWRRHQESFTRKQFALKPGNNGKLEVTPTWRGLEKWRGIRLSRESFSRHAEGFLIASKTLPQTPQLARVLELAQIIAKLDQRHSLADFSRLLRHDVLELSWGWRAWWTVALLLSTATPPKRNGISVNSILQDRVSSNTMTRCCELSETSDE